jgi:hypothetical protein
MNPAEEVLKSEFLQPVPITNFELSQRPKITQIAVDDLIPWVERGDDIIFGLAYTFSHEFCKSGGLELLETIFAPNGERAIPIDIANSILNIFKPTKKLLGTKTKECLVRIFKEYVLKQIDLITPEEVKDIDKDFIIEGLKNAKWLLEDDPEYNEYLFDDYVLQFFLKMIQSPYFEKKLKGVTDINEKISNLNYTKGDEEEVKKFLEWIMNSNVLKLIYNENSHPEIMKKGVGILIFLAKNKAITKELIDIVWNCQLDKHEDIVRAIYFSIEGLIMFLPVDVLFFTKR